MHIISVVEEKLHSYPLNGQKKCAKVVVKQLKYYVACRNTDFWSCGCIYAHNHYIIIESHFKASEKFKNKSNEFEFGCVENTGHKNVSNNELQHTNN